MLYKNRPVIVLESGPVLSRVYDEGKEEHDAYTVQTKDLKSRPVKRLSDVENMRNQDPEALAALVQYVARIEITCAPNAVDRCAEDISANSAITEFDATDYIKTVTDKSHGAKFDILVADSVPEDIRNRAGVFFHADGLRARDGELQINSKSLALYLMREHNFKPAKAAEKS